MKSVLNASSTLDRYSVERVFDRIARAAGYSAYEVKKMLDQNDRGLGPAPTFKNFKTLAALAGLEYADGPFEGSVKFSIESYGFVDEYVIKFDDKPAVPETKPLKDDSIPEIDADAALLGMAVAGVTVLLGGLAAALMGGDDK